MLDIEKRSLKKNQERPSSKSLNNKIETKNNNNNSRGRNNDDISENGGYIWI